MAENPIKNEVLVRVYTVLFLLVVIGVIVFSTAVRIQVTEGKKWRAQGQREFIKQMPVEAERGNIFTENGQLLATSIPVFDVAFDPNSRGMNPIDFNTHIDSLSYLITTYVDSSYTPGGYRDLILQKKEEGKKYIVIKNGASFAEKEMMSEFPLFNLGQFKGGFIVQPRYRRERPFGILARRTIGSIRRGANAVGLEGGFDQYLGGEKGKRLMLMVDREHEFWIPIDEYETIEPKRGDDIITTLDMDLQNITESALLRAMNYHEAEWGTAVVMEVKTGKIRAIANLGETSEGWWETYNYAVGAAIEPGSTFKLATMMALLEDGYIKLEDSIFLNRGQMEFYEDLMKDSYVHSYDSTTVRRAFEISSNVGLANLVNTFYNKPSKNGRSDRLSEAFINHLKSFKLHLPTGIAIEGEGRPYVKEAYSVQDNWSGTTLPWMSIGYEVMLTPLQLLTFYNAVANDGVMMKPYLVESVQHFGEETERFKPTIVDPAIASSATIDEVQSLLLGVVENGTAKKLKTDAYHFSGKTGTAQVNYQRLQNRTKVGGYQASFAGYFPSENPIYSCVVVINRPKENGIYGGQVAGPVFREIADKAFASRIELHEAINGSTPNLAKAELPDMDIGEKHDVGVLLNAFELPNYGLPGSDWAVLKATRGDSIKVLTRHFEKGEVPNVVGMGLRDALYVLENAGLNVKLKGVGKVQRQSIKPGTKITGQQIKLTLG
ncbi:MAG: penicillin-binding protein [Bacteroidota bacterium]